jgi:hypothetical protein
LFRATATTVAFDKRAVNSKIQAIVFDQIAKLYRNGTRKAVPGQIEDL